MKAWYVVNNRRLHLHKYPSESDELLCVYVRERGVQISTLKCISTLNSRFYCVNDECCNDCTGILKFAFFPAAFCLFFSASIVAAFLLTWRKAQPTLNPSWSYFLNFPWFSDFDWKHGVLQSAHHLCASQQLREYEVPHHAFIPRNSADLLVAAGSFSSREFNNLEMTPR